MAGREGGGQDGARLWRHWLTLGVIAATVAAIAYAIITTGGGQW